MNSEEKKEALDNIKFIKSLIDETKHDIKISGGGWISIIWGVFCLIGSFGQVFLLKPGPVIGLWWILLTVIAVSATIFVTKRANKERSSEFKKYIFKNFIFFWFPIIALAYTLCFFCIFSPDIPKFYIPIFILLVVSTAYIMIGLFFTREVVAMGIIGFIGTIITAAFFIEHATIILGLLFGLGLILTGIIINNKWK